MNILEVCPIIRLCRVLGSVRLGRSVTEGPFPNKKKICMGRCTVMGNDYVPISVGQCNILPCQDFAEVAFGNCPDVMDNCIQFGSIHDQVCMLW
jgi:hypothetical protein